MCARVKSFLQRIFVSLGFGPSFFDVFEILLSGEWSFLYTYMAYTDETLLEVDSL